MPTILSDQDLDTLFRAARSQNAWTDQPVTAVQVQAIYDLLRWGPTSANCSPARFVFVMSAQEKQKLAECVMSGNVSKVFTAPVVAIVGTDRAYYERIPELFPHNPGARDWFAGAPDGGAEAGFRNGTLQGAYLMMAARAIGLDCGPMSGFDPAKVDAAFFAGTTITSNFLCAIGHGDPAAVFERLPRLAFEDACRIV
jgi:nitroreductase